MASTPSKPPSSGSPPVNISPYCHLDPVSYVKGTHLLTLENGVLVHPRSKLFTDMGPITIKEGSIISEKCTIGNLSGKDSIMLHKGQAPKALLAATDSNTQTLGSNSGVFTQEGLANEPELPITIGRSVYIHPNVNLQPPCTVADFAILEPGVTVSPGCFINSHSKICAGVNLPAGAVVSSWTVVYGTDGRMRRRRHKDVSEDSRLEGMARERSAATNLLRTSANASKTGSTTPGSASRSKRESVIRS
ncbi:hypothetical protein H2198_006846 [Neophaeococcomyces mojaviensis]|uniref:Uncharacterized protein n=1 Tax=Neophaeococcomyces mojaviensis TaxID=3383035 RepID=A0ACC3A1Q1_9EURO|nr:hypothetical protein H2198_006846 [Knufia sp. JES_112]